MSCNDDFTNLLFTCMKIFQWHKINQVYFQCVWLKLFKIPYVSKVQIKIYTSICVSGCTTNMYTKLL